MILSRRIITKLKRATLLDSVVLVVLSLIVFIVMAFGGIVSRMLFNVAVQQTEYRAIQAVKSVSYIPLSGETEGIISKLENYRHDIKADRIVIFDTSGRKFITPADANFGRVTKYGLEKAMNGEQFFIVKDSINDLPAITAVGSLISESGKTIGSAAISYPLGWVETVIRKYYGNLVFHIFIFITLALIAAIFIAKRIKKSIFWMEPYEIAVLFQELSAIIESIKEAVIATDESGRIKMVNQQAVELLGNDIKDKKLQNMIPAIDIKKVTEETDEMFDMEVVYKGKELLVNLSPIKTGDSNVGAVATFRKKDEIEQIAKELTQVQEYAHMLRAQTHEFTNKMCRSSQG